MKGKMKGFGLYLIILVLLLAGVSYVVSQTQRTEQITYSDVFEYFTEGKVDQYTIDDSVLTMHLRDENRVVSYDISGSRDVFLNQLLPTIDEQMRDGTLKQVDYISTTIPWWAVCYPDRAARRVLVLYDEQAVRWRRGADAVRQSACAACAG